MISDTPRWTLALAVEQLRLYLPAYGRKMLRVCLMLLREEREALWAVRVLDAWRREEHYVRQYVTGSRFGMVVVTLQRQGEFMQCWSGKTEDDARIEAARALVKLYPDLEKGLGL